MKTENRPPVTGINIPTSVSDSTALERELESIKTAGFNGIELRMDAFPLIMGGKICNPWVKEIKRILQNFDFHLSVHSGRGLDFRNKDSIELHSAVLKSTIEVTGELGSRILVIHYEEESKNYKEEDLFLETLKSAADLAAELGILLCVENIETERVKPVLDFVKKAEHPNIRMTFDTGHAYLASKYYGFDFITSFREALPHISHIHLNDNLGIFEELRLKDRTAYDVMESGYRFTFARGDIHLPPFWGEIPFKEVLNCLKDYSGMYICEYNSRKFTPFTGEIRRRIEEEIRSAQS